MSEFVRDLGRSGYDRGHADRNRHLPAFNREALIVALRTDQAGHSTFLEFLAASWRAGVVRYDVDFAARTVTYYGANAEEYIEDYPIVEIVSSESAAV
jgi:uncharacterized protein YbcV (DUF1398 family)